MPVTEMKIVQKGSILVEAFEKAYSPAIALKKLCGVGGGSTVTYLQSDRRILVDTGFDSETNLSVENRSANERRLLQSLHNAGLSPEDIDAVFITHWHADHFLNLSLFPESEFLLSRTAVERHAPDYTGVRDGEMIADGVQVVYTPGHTIDHASLLVTTGPLRFHERTQGGGSISGIGPSTIAIAGDAVIDATYYALGRIWDYNSDFYSHEQTLESERLLCSAADFIIPGHGSIFMNTKKTSAPGPGVGVP